MSLYGSLGEGFTASYGTRPGEYLSRGLATFSAAATLVVTVPLPVRKVTHAVATLKATAAPSALVTVGNYANNTFEIYLWDASTSTAAGAAAAAVTVGASPFSYTATADGFVGFDLAGATVSAVSLTRGAYGPVDLVLPTGTLTQLYPCAKGDVFILTYSAGTPTLEALYQSSTLTALTGSPTVEWAAWGTL